MRPIRDLFYAWLAATLLSGIPSTSYALVTGGDPMEATRAAGAMAGRPDSILAAGAVHGAVSLFWGWVLWLALPLRHTTLWALAAAAAIAVLDLRIIAPLFFPAVAALAFWPQFAERERGDVLTSWVQAGVLAVFATLYFVAPSTSPVDVLMRPVPRALAFHAGFTRSSACQRSRQSQ